MHFYYVLIIFSFESVVFEDLFTFSLHYFLFEDFHCHLVPFHFQWTLYFHFECVPFAIRKLPKMEEKIETNIDISKIMGLVFSYLN